MKILLILTFVLAAFVAGANAQLCGTYTTTLEIKSEDNKLIENAVVQLLALEKDEARNKAFSRDEKNRSKFSITFNEGHIIEGKYKIFVSADGFEALEKEIRFPHCKDQTFEIKLSKESSQQPKMVLTGAVYDWNGAVIVGAKVTAYQTNGEKYESKTNNEGIYSILLPFDVYRFEVYSPGFSTLKIEKYRIVDSTYGKMNFDFVLEVAGNSETCGYGGADCLNDLAPVEAKAAKITDKISQISLEKLPKKQNKIKRKKKN
jgi:hypothetical protein